jgi:hypothetical protein
LKIVFSRKGFDSKSGGGPSPIIDGALFSLPIPSGKYPSASTYGALGLGDAVTKASKTLTAKAYATKIRYSGITKAPLARQAQLNLT